MLKNVFFCFFNSFKQLTKFIFNDIASILLSIFLFQIAIWSEPVNVTWKPLKS